MMLLFLLLVPGCKNACQQLCGDLQDYAKECGYDFTSEQLRQCYREHGRGDLEKGELGSCRDIAPNLREEWTCDDFEDYFDAQAQSGNSAE
jgi:hypothetical protein